MKKFLLTLCICLATLAGASAQSKGDMAVGLNLGVAPCLESGSSCTNFGLGAKFQYNVTDPIRLEADLEYWFKAKGIDVFDVTVNGHYMIPVADGFHLYPLIGIGYAHLSGWGGSSDKFLFNVGLGGEYALTETISVGAEFKYQYIKDFNRMPINIGVTYHF